MLRAFPRFMFVPFQGFAGENVLSAIGNSGTK